MNRKASRFFGLVFILPAMLVASLVYIQAQTITPGRIVKWFDDQGTLTDSVITETDGGNIGIGTTNPSRKLHVAGVLAVGDTSPGTWTTGGSDILLNAGAPGQAIYLRPNGDGSDIGSAHFSANGLHRFFDSLGNEQVRFNNGNVGIGTMNPTARLHVLGSFIATGLKSALVETSSYGKRQLYAMESPENWFEDFGRAQLRNGQAIVPLDPIFAETVNTENAYYVFLTPKGDGKGLYVAHQTVTSFEVRELQNGKSDMAFDYRIVAKRKGYEQARLAEVKDMQETQTPTVKLADTHK